MLRVITPIWALLGGLAACGGSGAGKSIGGETDEAGSTEDTGPSGHAEPQTTTAAVTLTPTAGVVIDPKLAGDPRLSFQVAVSQHEADTCELSVFVENGAGQRSSLAGEDAMDWSGRDDADLAFDPGAARVAATVQCASGAQASDSLDVWVLRVAPTTIDFISHPDDGANAPLAFHKTSLHTDGVSVIEVSEYAVGTSERSTLSEMDDDSGAARGAVEPYGESDVAPWGTDEPGQRNVPAAYVTGGVPRLEVSFGEVAVSELTRSTKPAFGGEGAPGLRLASSDMSPADSELVTPGATLTLDLEPMGATMGISRRTLRWSFEAEGPDGAWVALPGWTETQHDLYTLAGHPALLDGAAEDDSLAPPVAWIGVLADTAAAMEGVPATDADVLDTLRNHLHDHPYLIYDPGNSSYTDFEGPYIWWDSITADLSGFLDRSSGLRLYCHSMSCLLSVLAGHHGVEAPQLVLGTNFRTNQTRAAGTDAWRRWSFNSHSVVSPDDGAHIWDASIDLDGDEDPANEPIDAVAPLGMEGSEYLWRLSYDDIGVVNAGLCYMR